MTICDKSLPGRDSCKQAFYFVCEVLKQKIHIMKTLKIIAVLVLFFVSKTSLSQENLVERKYTDKPIVQMTLNGKKIWALLDTGSEYTILNINAKKRYAFDSYKLYADEYKFQGLGTQLMHMYTIRNAEIKFNDVKLLGNILAYDLSNIVESIKGRTGKTITAIIGTKMMKHHKFIIDLGSDKIVMGNATVVTNSPTMQKVSSN